MLWDVDLKVMRFSEDCQSYRLVVQAPIAPNLKQNRLVLGLVEKVRGSLNPSFP